MQQNFKPEFLNRIDDTIIFDPLKREEIKKIVDIHLKKVYNKLLSQKITIHFTEEVKNLLAEKGYDPLFGARPLKRVIQNEILNPLSMEIIEGKIGEGSEVNVTVENGKVKF